ncbi:MAG: beta-N-acetylhexosaminidase [Lachnospiraceae bacterium]|nr:beta-N-acetylhexosaminidase [Lachnospiraceae bacterium]
MENQQDKLQQRREIRRKRRQRNQILAYAAVLVMIALVGFGVVCGVKYMTGRQEQARQAALEQQESQQAMLEQQFASQEESLEAPQEEAESQETVPELTPEEKLDEVINAMIDAMPIEDKVAGLFFVTPEAITGVDTAVKAGDGTKDALTQYAVGGIIYSKKNIKDAEQFREMLNNTELYSKYPIFLGVEEEGGSISPLAAAGLTDKQASAAEIGESGDAGQAYQAGTGLGTGLADYGINVDFAPVADLANVEKSVMDSRAYGDDASAVSAYVVNMMNGLQEQGVTACIKHFPCGGSTQADTHDGLAVSERSEEELRSQELAVYQSCIDAGAQMIMVGHTAVPALTGDNTPASLSGTVVTELLRNEMGYQGVIITDAMDMKAISEYYGSGQAAVMALKAGCDMILMPEDFQEAYEAVLAAVQDGTISEDRINDALRRIYRIKCADRLEQE